VNEAEVLFSEVLNCSRAALYLNRQRVLTRDESGAIAAALKRRASGEPLEYILGAAEFMGLEFKVSPAVLIPRPETEILVEAVIEISRQADKSISRQKILDLGTGSGCIAVSLAKFLPKAEVTAVDISQEALKVAAENAMAHNVKVDFMRSDLFSALSLSKYDIIVSNPPYIASGEIGQLQRELKYEPQIALDAGPDGREFYRRIIDRAGRHLEDGGSLIMEIGFGQRGEIENIFKKSKTFKITQVIKDYNNIDRVVTARRQLGG
jgi:release factor glutamine methyltransferase